MDIVFMITAIFLVFLIVAVYILNSVKKTTDLKSIFEALLKSKPDTVSFCLGKIESTGKYRNVVLDQDNEAVVREDDYPIGLDGKYIILSDHGTVSPLASGDGFKISGIDLIEFSCPAGFEGETCTLIPLCSEADAGQYKALTYTQFNELGLYSNSFMKTPIESRAGVEPTHPRIRVLCLTNNEYELQTCPSSTLLDENLQCKPYDICEDRINGYKHNFKISTADQPLNKNEYYICDNNASVLTTCSDNTVFSMSNSGCITESICFNKGSATIAYDDTSYIQCSNDQGLKVNCPDGIDDQNGVLSCKVNTCIPEEYTFSDEIVTFKYGSVVCIDNVSDVKMCDATPQPKTFTYKWAESTTFTIESWPTEVLDDNRNCVAPTNDIISNPLVQLQWTDAMLDEHEYNIMTDKYTCPEDTAYVIDYKNQTVEPEVDGPLNHLSPCQNALADISATQFQLFAPTFPTLYMFLYSYVYIPDYSKYSLWPIKYKAPSNTYKVTSMWLTESELTITTRKSSKLPLGFSDPTDIDVDNRLLYNGYKEYTIDSQLIYYFAVSGKYESTDMYESDISEADTIPVKSTVDTTESDTFAVNMTLMDDTPIEILPNITFSREKFTIDSTTYAAGYIIMTITVGETSADTATLKIGSLDPIEFIPDDHPTIQFY